MQIAIYDASLNEFRIGKEVQVSADLSPVDESGLMSGVSVEQVWEIKDILQPQIEAGLRAQRPHFRREDEGNLYRGQRMSHLDRSWELGQMKIRVSDKEYVSKCLQDALELPYSGGIDGECVWLV